MNRYWKWTFYFPNYGEVTLGYFDDQGWGSREFRCFWDIFQESWQNTHKIKHLDDFVDINWKKEA